MNSPLRSGPRALLICNGEPPSRTLLRRLAADVDVIVAADGGANVARAAGVRPDLIIGDLDSITPGTRRHFSRVLFLRVARQDNTDLEKALDYLAEEKVKEVVITAAAGHRLDFTLANLSVLWRYAARFRLCVAGDGWRALPAGRMNRIVSVPGATVSLLPFGRVTGITLRGLRYPLLEGTLRVGQVAVSNVVERSPFTVRVRTGSLLIVIQDRLLPTSAAGERR